MGDVNPSLYEMLLQNFHGELDLHCIGETEQHTLSVLDNIRRVLGSRAGTLSHLPDYGLPDMGVVLQGLPATAHKLIETMTKTLLKYEPRLTAVNVELLPQQLPGHLEYALDVQLKAGLRVTFGTTLGPEGKVLVRHLGRQYGTGLPWQSSTCPSSSSVQTVWLSIRFCERCEGCSWQFALSGKSGRIPTPVELATLAARLAGGGDSEGALAGKPD